MIGGVWIHLSRRNKVSNSLLILDSVAHTFVCYNLCIDNSDWSDIAEHNTLYYHKHVSCICDLPCFVCKRNCDLQPGYKEHDSVYNQFLLLHSSETRRHRSNNYRYHNRQSGKIIHARIFFGTLYACGIVAFDILFPKKGLLKSHQKFTATAVLFLLLLS